MPEKHLHIVAFDIPYPANYGGIIDVLSRIQLLAQQGVKIHLHCFQYAGHQPDDTLLNWCVEVKYYNRHLNPCKLLSHKPFITQTRRNEKLVQDLLRDEYPILLEGLHCCSILDDHRFANRKILVRSHNVEHEYYLGLAKNEKNIFKKIYFLQESKKLQRFEPIINKAFANFCITQKDYEYFSSKYDNSHFLPSPLTFTDDVPKQSLGDYVLYHGRLDIAENIAAVNRILTSIIPNDDIPLIIAGLNPQKDLISHIAQRPNTKLIISPSEKEMNSLIANAQINLLITDQPTGIKLKLLHALQTGRHCLVNNAMLAGTPFEPTCVIADSDEDFHSKCKELMNVEFSEDMRRKRDEILKSHNDNSLIINKLLSLI